MVAFDGKLGDTLLALSGVCALLDWLRLRSVRVAVRAVGPYAGLIARAGLITKPQTTRPSGWRAVIGDRTGIETHGSEAAVRLVLDPAAAPCWSSDSRAHPDLPPVTTWRWSAASASAWPTQRPSLPRSRPGRTNSWRNCARCAGWVA
ncbi:hypothetical protein ACQEVX_27460 [Streptomyces syringium]|uniref:hypothetical protein n=1 Tax=Streptomyces syringium TaxID=76729 RepID=UPI003D941A2B